MNLKSKEIIDRIQAGDEVAFNAMYEGFYDRILNYALRRTLDQQVAEDICANVFIKIVQKIGKFKWQHENSFSGWVFRIAGGEVADYFRKLDRYHFAPPEDIEIIMNSQNLNDTSYKQVEKQIDDSRDFVVLQKAIRQLKPQHQEIIHLLRSIQNFHLHQFQFNEFKIFLVYAFSKCFKTIINQPHLDNQSFNAVE